MVISQLCVNNLLGNKSILVDYNYCSLHIANKIDLQKNDADHSLAYCYSDIHQPRKKTCIIDDD